MLTHMYRVRALTASSTRCVGMPVHGSWFFDDVVSAPAAAAASCVSVCAAAPSLGASTLLLFFPLLDLLVGLFLPLVALTLDTLEELIFPGFPCTAEGSLLYGGGAPLTAPFCPFERDENQMESD